MDKNKVAVNTYNKIAQEYTEAYFDELTDLPYLNVLFDSLNKRSKILDAGCGPGTYTKPLLEKGYQVIGIDLSEEMLKIAKQRIPNGKFKQMDIRDLKFPEKNFDAVLSAYSIIHIPSKEIKKTLEGFKKVLKNKGLLLIMAQKGKADYFIAEPLNTKEKMFFNFFTKRRLNKYLKEAKFTILSQKSIQYKDPDSFTNNIIYTLAKVE